MKRYLACVGAWLVLVGSANAANTEGRADDSLTSHGITLYETVDMGYTYQTRGAPLNDDFPNGLQYLIQPSNNRSILLLSERGMSQSETGLGGSRGFFEGWSGLFKLETRINPLSGNLSDALDAITAARAESPPRSRVTSRW